MTPDVQDFWLARAIEGDGKKPWSSNQLRAAVAQSAAFDRTRRVELEARSSRQVCGAGC